MSQRVCVCVGDEEVDGKTRASTTAKYVNDFSQLVLMYTSDISVIELHIPKLISLTKFGKSYWVCQVQTSLLNVRNSISFWRCRGECGFETLNSYICPFLT